MLVDFEKLKYWLFVDLYIGGVEYVVFYLLYVRFWYKVFYDLVIVFIKEFF